MEERLRRLKALTRAGQAMGAILDLDTLLDRILSLVDEVFHFSQCAVLLLDDTANELFILKARGYDPAIVRSFRASPGYGITGAVLAGGEPIAVEDVTKDGRYVQGVPGARSEIAAPLVVDELIIGVLDAESATPMAFTEEDVEMFSIFASHAATAIHNARLHYRVALHSKVLERRMEQLGGILGSLALVTSGEEPNRALRLVLENAADAVDCDGCGVLWLDPGREHLTPGLETGGSVLPRSRVEVSMVSPLVRDTIRDAEPTAVEDLRSESPLFEHFPTEGSAMVAPIRRAGEVVGLLAGHRGLGDPPGELDLALFAGFAALLGLISRVGNT